METIIFIGAPASGKSEFYKQHFYKTHIRLNLDMLKTRNRESILLEACLKAKQPVVIDNTNPTKEDRQRYIPHSKKNKFYVVGYYFSSKIADCIARNNMREGEEKLPDVGVFSVYSKLEIPGYDEGFDKLFYVSIAKDNTFKIEEYNNEI